VIKAFYKRLRATGKPAKVARLYAQIVDPPERDAQG
jgi:hypothetical protein